MVHRLEYLYEDTGQEGEAGESTTYCIIMHDCGGKKSLFHLSILKFFSDLGLVNITVR